MQRGMCYGTDALPAAYDVVLRVKTKVSADEFQRHAWLYFSDHTH